jgi:hypothetical protein
MEATMILMCGASVGGAFVGLLDPSDKALRRIILGRVPEAQLAALSILLTLEDIRKKNYFGAEFDEDERAGLFWQFPYDILASMCGG